MPVHLDGVEPVQHGVQLLEADLPLEGGKVDVIAQNRRLESGVQGIRRGADHGTDPVEPVQHIAVADLLLLGEPVVGKAEMLGKELRDAGGVEGRGHFHRSVAQKPHKIPGEGGHLFLISAGRRRLAVPLQQAQDALRIESHTFTSS